MQCKVLYNAKTIHVKKMIDKQSEDIDLYRFLCCSGIKNWNLGITWKIFCSSGTLFDPIYSAVGPASDTILVGKAKIRGEGCEGTMGFSPCGDWGGGRDNE